MASVAKVTVPSARVDPLDFLFAPTASVPPSSAEPVRPLIGDAAAPAHRPTVRGASRAGNAMARTRAAVLVGARIAIAESGTSITMTQVAAASGIAKATLYNHFRSREAVLDAVLAEEVRALLIGLDALPLGDALAEAATRIGRHPLLRALGESEPATLSAIARIDLSSPHWRRCADELRGTLERSRRGGGELVLRWLSSFVCTPCEAESATSVAAGAAALVRGLPITA
jgi:AcrR family transcriptional regulator